MSNVPVVKTSIPTTNFLVRIVLEHDFKSTWDVEQVKGRRGGTTGLLISNISVTNPQAAAATTDKTVNESVDQFISSIERISCSRIS